MIFFPLGLLIAAASLGLSIWHLKQSFSSYYDFVALTMVLGGTLAVAVIVLPFDAWRDLARGFRGLFIRTTVDRRRLVECGLRLVQAASSGPATGSYGASGLPGRILDDGAELIDLGFAPQKIESILRERVYSDAKRAKRVGAAVRSLAKYPPGFGLVGTVLGLVNLMRGISQGLTAQQTGLEMAVALVATFYGLLFANLLINPAGEMIQKIAADEEDAADIAVQAVALAAERSSLLEAQEMLNAYLDDRSRVNYIGGAAAGSEEAA